MRARKVLLTIAAAGLAVAMALPSHAERLRADFFGQIDVADPGNLFGVSAGDAISGFAIYDTLAAQPISGTTSVWGTPLPAGNWSSIVMAPGDTFVLSLTVGPDNTFPNFDQIDAFTSFQGNGVPPELLFLDGFFVGFDYFAENGELLFFQTIWDPAFLPLFAAGDDFSAGGIGNIEGFFTFPPDLVRPVDDNNNIIPEPGTMILLGSGLLGLAGRARKRRNG